MEYKTDVLIVGAGGAGLMAAIEAADLGAEVVVIGKTLLGKAHTVMAEGGINAALGNVDSPDNWTVHFADTMKEGQMINNWQMVETITKEAPKIIKKLESYGALFDRTPEGKVMQRAFGGQSFRRTCHIADRTGLEIMQALSAEVRRRNIKNIEECIITKIVRIKNKVVGALGISLRSGEIISIDCKAIILATGGLARVYSRSTNAWETVGDGYALALDAGAELQDMEMVQFHPTGMVYPESAEGLLVTESVRGEGGILLNAKNERFMSCYDPARMELSTRDVVARAIFKEIVEGRGTRHNGVWLDISHKPKDFIEKKLPKMIGKFKDFADIDITKEKMEVAPSAHYAMGGLCVHSETCQSSVEGLFAAGEVAAGVHGANRLGGNSLLDILVFGRISGRNAALYATHKESGEILPRVLKQEEQRLCRPFERQGVRAIDIKKRLQSLMWTNAGIVRNETQLNFALKEIKNIKKDAERIEVRGSRVYNHDWIQYIDVMAMIPVCEMIVSSALMRKESRGAHYRSDYLEKKDLWLKNIVVRKDGENLKLLLRPVPEVPERLKVFLK